MACDRRTDVLRLRDGPIAVSHLTPKRPPADAGRERRETSHRLYDVFAQRQRPRRSKP